MNHGVSALNTSACCWARAGLVLLAVLAAPHTVAAQEDERHEPPSVEANDQRAVEDAREGLAEWWVFPWYDSAQDDLAPVKVRKSRESWSWKGPSWAFDASLLEQFLQALPWIALFLAIGAIVYLGWRLFWRQEAAGVHVANRAANEHQADHARLEALPFPVDHTTGDLLAEARRQYEAGNYARAIIYLFSHQLVECDRRQLIRLARGKTNRQYLRELGRRDALRTLVEHTMITFEAVFFGDHPLDRTGFERCWRQLDQFQALVEGGTA
ncbi:MAG: DUF4129 domain-containing protein [Pirellulales bacterium]|nr:DUF4129 domain-containing protein [Pirellulales bacterium]